MEQREMIMKVKNRFRYKRKQATASNNKYQDSTQNTLFPFFSHECLLKTVQPYNTVFVQELDFYSYTPVMADVMRRGGERRPLHVEKTAWESARRSSGTVRGGHGVRPDTVSR